MKKNVYFYSYTNAFFTAVKRWYEAQPFNTVTWYDLLLRGEQINEFAPMTETELRLKLQ